MKLLDDVNRFIAGETEKIVQSAKITRENVLANCRRSEAMQLIPVLKFEPIDEDIEEVRIRLNKLTSDPVYCGKHQHILDIFDKDPDNF